VRTSGLLFATRGKRSDHGRQTNTRGNACWTRSCRPSRSSSCRDLNAIVMVGGSGEWDELCGRSLVFLALFPFEDYRLSLRACDDPLLLALPSELQASRIQSGVGYQHPHVGTNTGGDL
jgi:hypothetical protein